MNELKAHIAPRESLVPAGRDFQQRGPLAEICEAISVCLNHGRAREVQERVRDALAALGYGVDLEHPVPRRGDGRSGKIDLWLPDVPCAIEIDNRSARKKSLTKLRCKDALRVVVLRLPLPQPFEPPLGIHAVVGLAEDGNGWTVLTSSFRE